MIVKKFVNNLFFSLNVDEFKWNDIIRFKVENKEYFFTDFDNFSKEGKKFNNKVCFFNFDFCKKNLISIREEKSINSYWAFFYKLNLELIDNLSIQANYGEIKKAFSWFETKTNNPINEMIFNELLLNAFEHGSLNIDANLKRDLILEGKFDTFLKTQNSNKIIKIEIFKFEDLLAIKIIDQGKGFEIKDINSLVNGRGIKMSMKYCYNLFYNKKGNEVIFFVKE